MWVVKPGLKNKGKMISNTQIGKVMKRCCVKRIKNTKEIHMKKRLLYIYKNELRKY